MPFNLRPGIPRTTASGSGARGHRTLDTRRPRQQRPRLRHRPEVRGTLRKDGTPPTCRKNRKRPPSHRHTNCVHSPAVQRMRSSSEDRHPPSPRSPEPPSHSPLPPSDHGGPPERPPCRRPLSQTRSEQWCKGRPPAASDAANHGALLSMSCVCARQQMPSCLGNLPSESLPLASIPACFMRHRTGRRSGCSPGAGTARCAVG
ncbi:hypothetical protein B0T18DRAFT_37571 [Schizothecium vesticola]|uniref:Uncharacterized protein n=1 Tax=Schizothecium vesticola TaxID=314040 RepID=A0AA40KD37_9PEZI|nr:hypothetical protein B0T18DRAFT_37571 [Schizothecium vesticola]